MGTTSPAYILTVQSTINGPHAPSLVITHPLGFQQNYRKAYPWVWRKRLIAFLVRPNTEPLLGVVWSPYRTSDPSTEPWSAHSTAPMRVHDNPYRSLARSPAHLRTRDYRPFAR